MIHDAVWGSLLEPATLPPMHPAYFLLPEAGWLAGRPAITFPLDVYQTC